MTEMIVISLNPFNWMAAQNAKDAEILLCVRIDDLREETNLHGGVEVVPCHRILAVEVGAGCVWSAVDEGKALENRETYQGEIGY